MIKKHQIETHKEVYKILSERLFTLYKNQIVIKNGTIIDMGYYNTDIAIILNKWKNYCNKAQANPKILYKPNKTFLKEKFEEYKTSIKINAYINYVYQECKARYNMTTISTNLLAKQIENLTPDEAITQQFEHLCTSYEGLKNNPDAKVKIIY